MKQVSENIERLIFRRLDGELTDDERRMLDRELRRSVEARERLAAYERVDALASRVIAHSTASRTPRAPALVVPPLSASAARPSSRRAGGGWMYAASALAASLALVLIWKTPADAPRKFAGETNHPARHTSPRRGPALSVQTARAPQGPDVGVWPVEQPPAVRRDRFTDRNLIVVPDKKGNLYLIRVDHVREVDQPRDRPGVQNTRNPV